MERRDSVAEGEVEVEDDVEEEVLEMAVGRSCEVGAEEEGDEGISRAEVLGREGRGGGWFEVEVEVESKWEEEAEVSTTMGSSIGVAAAEGMLSSWKVEGSSEGEIP